MDYTNDFKKLQERLGILELKLRELIANTEDDLNIAKLIQKTLLPERLPDIHGLKAYAKYLSAEQVCADFYDLIPHSDKWGMTLVAAWTETYGLSSLLLQTLMHLQSQKILQSGSSEFSAKQFFEELSSGFREAKRAGRFSLMVAQIDIKSLKLNVCTWGTLPFLVRIPSHSSVSEAPFECLGLEHYQQKPEALLSQSSSQSEIQYLQYSVQLKPGSRLYYMSPSWWNSERIETLMSKLKLEELPQTKPQSELIEDINFLMFAASEYLKEESRKADISCVGIQISPKILHLA